MIQTAFYHPAADTEPMRALLPRQLPFLLRQNLQTVLAAGQFLLRPVPFRGGAESDSRFGSLLMGRIPPARSAVFYPGRIFCACGS